MVGPWLPAVLQEPGGSHSHGSQRPRKVVTEESQTALMAQGQRIEPVEGRGKKSVLSFWSTGTVVAPRNGFMWET